MLSQKNRTNRNSTFNHKLSSVHNQYNNFQMGNGHIKLSKDEADNFRKMYNSKLNFAK